MVFCLDCDGRLTVYNELHITLKLVTIPMSYVICSLFTQYSTIWATAIVYCPNSQWTNYILYISLQESVR